MILEFEPAVEARIIAVAKSLGLTPGEYVKKLILRNLPPMPIDPNSALPAD